MASNSFLGEGSNINRPPSFNGEHYDFWKIRMKIFIESQDMEIWDAVENGPFIPSHLVSGVVVVKPKSAWDNDDKKKVQYDLKAKNILTSALGIDEFFRVSNCKSSKEMWDTLETTHEGTDEVKRSRLNTLSQEYELFRMLPNEKIIDMQKRFIHLTNHLKALGKDLSTSDLNLKVLRSLTRLWQPKVTAISEKKSLSKMSLATLFGKLQEHELELERLEQTEEVEKHHKSIAFKAITKERSYENTNNDDADMTLLLKKFGKFLKKKKAFKSNKFSKKNENVITSQNITCYECGKSGHIRTECPHLNKSRKASKRTNEEWDDNEDSSSSESEDEENGQIALMASYQSDGENDEVLPFTKENYDELLDAFNELHDEYVKLSKTHKMQQKSIISLEEKYETHHDKICDKCALHENKIIELENVIKNYESSTHDLNSMLSVQKNFHDKSGIGFTNKNSQSNTTIFVRPNTQLYTYDLRRSNTRNKVYDHKNPKCSYCKNHGHTPNTCFVRKIGVPNGLYMWVKKGTNIQGPKSHWVPNAIT